LTKLSYGKVSVRDKNPHTHTHTKKTTTTKNKKNKQKKKKQWRRWKADLELKVVHKHSFALFQKLSFLAWSKSGNLLCFLRLVSTGG